MCRSIIVLSYRFLRRFDHVGSNDYADPFGEAIDLENATAGGRKAHDQAGQAGQRPQSNVDVIAQERLAIAGLRGVVFAITILLLYETSIAETARRSGTAGWRVLPPFFHMPRVA